MEPGLVFIATFENDDLQIIEEKITITTERYESDVWQIVLSEAFKMYGGDNGDLLLRSLRYDGFSGIVFYDEFAPEAQADEQ